MYTIYLLHFGAKQGRAQHYLGITEANRLPIRLHEHATGKGAKLTAVVARKNIPMYVARLMTCDDPKREKQVKRTGHLHSYCPICCKNQHPGLVAHCINPMPRPEQPAPGRVFQWDPSPLENHQAIEKGGVPE